MEGHIICIDLGMLILGLSYKLNRQAGDVEKKITFECGFSPYETIKRSFEIRFYIVAILFILFDLEVSILFTLGKIVNIVGEFGYTTCSSFLIILTVGLAYEWKKNALTWE